MQQTVIIKGMVCNRCITSVTHQLHDLGIRPDEVNLGEVKFPMNVPFTEYEALNKRLMPLGFSVVENKRTKMVRQIKQIVAEVYSGDFDFPYHFRLSDLLTKKLEKDYHMISQVFTSETGNTIENYVLTYRTEKVKNFLTQTANTLSDISFQLGFSSVAHLSRQFKQLTGLTPSQYRSMNQNIC